MASPSPRPGLKKNGQPYAAVNKPRARAWLFTIPNPTDNQLAWFRDPTLNTFNASYGVKYVIAAEETGAGGLHHIQGFIGLSEGISLQVCVNLFRGPGFAHPHCIIARGTGPENRKYCTKDVTDDHPVLLEYGVCPTPGKVRPTDANPTGLNAMLLNFREAVRKPISMSKLFDDHFLAIARYTSGCMKLLEHERNLRLKPKPKVFVLFGPTGTGKSHWIRESFGRDPTQVYWATCSQKIWYGGYIQQEVMVYDDFEPRNMDRQIFKLLTDEYSCLIEPKGSQIPMVSKYIIFSTNTDPKGWYRDPEIQDPDQDLHYLACQRRIPDVMTFLNVYDPNNNSYASGHLPFRVSLQVLDPEPEPEEEEDEPVFQAAQPLPPFVELALSDSDDEEETARPKAPRPKSDFSHWDLHEVESDDEVQVISFKPAPEKPENRKLKRPRLWLDPPVRKRGPACTFIDVEASDDEDDEENEEEEEENDYDREFIATPTDEELGL